MTGTFVLLGLAAINAFRPLPHYLVFLGWLEIVVGSYFLLRGEAR
jgi:hypothetical protein